MSLPIKKRILCVEDDLEMANLYKELLEKEGYMVDVAHDGEEGLRMILTDKYDLITLDHLMPKIAGDKLLEILDGKKLKGKIGMLTDIYDRTHFRQAFEHGIFFYLDKSKLSQTEFVEEINHYINSEGTYAHPAKTEVAMQTAKKRSKVSQTNLFTDKIEEKVYANQATWAKLVKNRDGWECANKSKYPDRDHELFNLNAHHVRPKKHNGKNVLSNGITYCRACHAAEHPEYQQKFVDVFKLELIFIKDMVFSLFGEHKELQYHRLLKFLTGQSFFRPLQKEIIKTIVEEKKHVFVVMPTGVGKSLLYQIPGLMSQDNPTLVISPLKALQTNQVSQLTSRWVPATYINSSLNKSEIDERIKSIRDKLFPFVFIHPKQLLSYKDNTQEISVKFAKPLASVPFDHIVIDEVHVVKSQGLSFVKEYYHLDEIYKLYNKPKMILLTATASKKTRDFIVERLGLLKGEVTEFVSGFERPEIALEVHRTNTYSKESCEYISKDEKLISLLTRKPQGKTIIFATTTDQVDQVHKYITERGYVASKYHSKLSDDEKEINYKMFIDKVSNNEVDIMVATSAFGMGINIPNIHQVIHYSLPFSITDYYQQFGRAGRDGMPSVAHLLYDEKESTGMIDFINGKTLENEKSEKVREILVKTHQDEKDALLGYVNAKEKWRYILDYFGQPSKPPTASNFWLYILVLFAVLGYIFFLLYSTRYH